jgi:transcription-repair coupling factor (superfamily II helicase)
MDRPILYSLVERLRAEDKLREFAAALPARARVSEPALALLLAALHDEAGRGLLVLLAEDADARDAAEGAAWFIGGDRVGLFPSRGVRHGSGLEPPPHLVGERLRAIEILAAGGLVCASAVALAEGIAPASQRPAPLRIAPGDEPGIDAVVEHLALAGYERVERVEERGHFAVRGGLVDVFPATGREPLRIELFGDEIEQIRAFSPFTQRALRRLEEATIYPASERRRDTSEIDLGPEADDDAPLVEPDDLVPPFDGVPDLVWQPDEVNAVWAEEGYAALSLDGAAELTPLPQGQPFSFDAQRPALAARGLSEAEHELGGLLRQGLDVVVSFPHRGEALRQQQLMRRSEATILEDGDGPAGLTFAVSPARRGFVWRDLGLALLPDTQVFRKRVSRATAAPGRALQSFSDLRTSDYVVHEDHRRHPRLPAARVPRGRPRLRPPRADRQGQPLRRGRREEPGAVEARRQGVGQPEEPRARASARDGGRPHAPLRRAPDPPGLRLRR